MSRALVVAAMALIAADVGGRATVTAASGASNVAAAVNGGVATASSSWQGYPPSAVNNGDRRGAPYGAGGTWSDGSGNVFPDWVQVDFAGAKTIEEIDVIALQDNHSAPVDPTPTSACSGCPLDFTVQYWTGTSWQAVPNGVVRDNTLVWRRFTFAPLTTSKIRVLVERSATGWAELAEIEAYTTTTGNVWLNAPPTVSLLSPAGGATFPYPATVAMAASAADSDGVVMRVDFYAGATLVGSDTTSPYALTWAVPGEGTYLVKAVATDDKGAIATSTTSSITVSSNAAPLVSLTSPANNATFVAPAAIVLSATASDPDGTVKKVEFYSGTTLLAIDSTPPYTYTWNGVAAGTYSVSAMAYDNLDSKTLAAWRDVTVTNGVVLSKAVFVPAIVPDYVRYYLVEIFAAGADPASSTPVAAQDVGLPAVVQGECTADVKNTILGLAPGSWVATVSAITGQGSKLRSNAFAFTR